MAQIKDLTTEITSPNYTDLFVCETTEGIDRKISYSNLNSSIVSGINITNNARVFDCSYRLNGDYTASDMIVGAVLTGTNGSALLAGQIVLRYFDTNKQNNGLWVIQTTGAAIRYSKADTGGKLMYSVAMPNAGTYAGKWYKCTNYAAVIGTDSVEYSEIFTPTQSLNPTDSPSFADITLPAGNVQTQISANRTQISLKQDIFSGLCPETPITISIDYSTRILTVSPVTGQFAFFTSSNGVPTKHLKAGIVEFPAFTDTTGMWYFYFNSDGDAVVSQTTWSDFDTVVPVYALVWNNSKTGANKSITEYYEGHTNTIPGIDHTWKHAYGAIWKSGLEVVHNALASGAPNIDGRNTCISITAGTAIDDNIQYSITNGTGTSEWEQDLGISAAGSLTSSNSGIFNIRYRGTSGQPELVTGTRFPFLWNVTTNIPEYVDSYGVRQPVTDDYYFVYFAYILQDKRNKQTVRLTPVYNQFATLSAAQATTWATVQAQDEGARSNEIRVLYRFIFQFNNSGAPFDVAVKYTVLREVTDLRKVVIAQASSMGGTLPATNISLIPSGGVSSTNVQSAINELDTEKMNTWVSVPASASATGIAGQMAYESGFLYICVATNTWQRVAIATWT